MFPKTSCCKRTVDSFMLFYKNAFFSFWQSESTICKKSDRLFVFILSQVVNYVNQI